MFSVDLRAKLAIVFVIYFFTFISINTLSFVNYAVMLGFLCGCAVYHKELYYFITARRIVLAYPLILLLSATWSISPSQSLWYGWQVCLCFAVAVLIGISASPRQIARGLFVAMAIIIVASLISGRKGAAAEGLVLVGVTGGKTAIGLCAVTLVASAMAVLFDREQPFSYRIATFPFIPLGGYIAMHVHAATAVAALAAFPVVFFVILGSRYFNLLGRVATVALILAVAVPALIVVLSTAEISGQDILQTFHKDRTLTGRTVIWAKADAWIAQSPILGYGYRAFWTSGSSDSVGILHFFRVPDPRGFQLHNTVKEVRVETGWPGLITLFVTLAFFLYYIVAYAFLHPSPASALLAAMYLMMLAHIPIETVIGIFFLPTFLLYVPGTAAVVFFMNKRRQLYDDGNELVDESAQNSHLTLDTV